MTDENQSPKNEPSNEGIKSLLTQSLQITTWGEFKTNYNSENYLILEPELDLVEACLHIVKDNAEEIQKLIQENKIRRVPLENLEHIPLQSQIQFLIVQPYTVYQLFAGV